jgi:Mrp family chromosome partitioning ATPase
MSQVLNALKERADLVIIDTPPVLPVTDAVVLAPLMDGVLLVTTAQTPRPALLKAREQLELAEATLLGAVLNKITGKSVRGGYYYYGYYGYYYTYYGSPD